MLKIAYIIPSLIKTGPNIVVKYLVDEMVKLGHCCYVYYLDESRGLELACGSERLSFSKQISWNHFSIVHSHGIRPNLYVLSHRPFGGKTKCVTTFHSYFFEELRCDYGWLKGSIYSFLFLMSAARHHRIVALSKDAQMYYSRFYSSEKVDYVYDGLDFKEMGLDVIKKKQHMTSKPGNVCVVGTYCVPSPLKGLDVLSEAVKRLGNDYKLLVLYGKEDVYKDLDRFDVFVISSYTEGFCLALLEAAAAGKNIVCSDIPGMREKYSDDEVTYFPAGQVTELAKAIKEAQHSNKGGKAHMKAMTFSAHRMGMGYDRVYKLLSKKT